MHLKMHENELMNDFEFVKPRLTEGGYKSTGTDSLREINLIQGRV